MSNGQNEYGLPTPGNEKRTASELLPRFFRTTANTKFLQATIDQLIQPGVAEKINGYTGRKTAKAFNPTDNYIGDVTANRENYQLEPAMVIKDNLDNVTVYKDYNDYINQLGAFGSNTTNHSRLNSQETYAWNPNIDWDKFANFREYYWLPTGPIGVPVRGQSIDVTSTYTVTAVQEDDNVAYVFNDGFTRNPDLKLYRGQTYRFEIDTPGNPIAFAVTRSFTPGNAVIVAGTEGIRGNGLYDATLYGNEYDIGDYIVLPSSGSVTFGDADNVSTLFPDGIRKLGESGEEIANVYIEKGTIEFTIPYNAPEKLYYISKNDIDTSGLIKIYDIEENTFLDIENEILGKKKYTSSNGIALTNGLKVYFQGSVTPSKYENGNWYVEGVGEKIKLINEYDLTIPSTYSSDTPVEFDAQGFDILPYANTSSYPGNKDYFVINRSSVDRNAWTRYNRWFHKDVVFKSFEYNGLPIDIDESTRAKRPIIEFEAGLKLYKYGTEAKQDIDLIDVYTKDVFSTIEGSLGYIIDGVELSENMRVMFVADTDILVRNKIFQVNFITLNGIRQISLTETSDSEPLELETTLVRLGNKYAGKIFYYDGIDWKATQEKTKNNQPPKFDLCCPQGNFYSDPTVFNSSTFTGTKIFSYKEGTGVADSELGFALEYRNIENSGDIVFEFNLLTDTFLVQTASGNITIKTDTANLRKYNDRTTFNWVNGWSSTPTISKQRVLRQYNAVRGFLNNFEIDVYDNAGELTDLNVAVYVNNQIKRINVDYIIFKTNYRAYIRFIDNLSVNDVVLLKTQSSAVKNLNGWYEFPINLEKNPLNADITEFTLGEVIDHVNSMIEELSDFTGIYPGISNLRDLGDLDKYGKRFVKHSGPINLPLYHITSKQYNIVKALEHSSNEYSKYKRIFLETASDLGYDGPIKNHVDAILTEINQDKIRTQPYYFSDMFGYVPTNRIEYEVLDASNPYYSLTQSFSLTTLTSSSVNVYLNGIQLVHSKDYTFSNEGFVLIDANQQEGDIIEIYEYDTTDGSYVPPTPSKLGLYPTYRPELTIDDTYLTSVPESTGPFKIYGERSDTHARGWFYPVYISKRSAQDADTDGQATLIQLAGLSKLLYVPASSYSNAAQYTNDYDEYPYGTAMVRGHDGSYIAAFKDYRDGLLLEFETRIFNNIKVNYNSQILDINDFVGGKFRDTGFTKSEIDNSLLQDFIRWLTLVDNDYTTNDFINRENQFTFNYSTLTSVVDGAQLPGFWRGVYLEAFDTDRPHSHPWEILGITIKPIWWDTVYGAAPYTSNNLVLWDDIEQGIIREPNKPVVIKEKYARPGLRNFIPANEQGLLRSPIESNYAKNFFFRSIGDNFKFGDHSPVETAWRRSSEYPFSIIKSWLIHQPSKVMGVGFDLSRIQKNLAGQNIYSETGKHLTLDALVFPNSYQDSQRIMTSGLVNYIYNLIANNVLSVYEDYKTEIKSINNQLGFKIGGFTDKSKFKLVLDSRSPTQTQVGGIFVPEDNYQVFLNTSSVVDVVVYSGLIIEKASDGYIVRGYNNEAPIFNYFAPINSSRDISVTVGGISEESSEWQSGKPYVKGQLLQNANKFYRVTSSFTSGDAFSTDNLALLKEVPIVGGKTAIFARSFNNRTVYKMPYGTKIKTSQEVIDFILGYDAYLKTRGFSFNYFNNDTGYVENWDHSAREFLFWTTQGWASRSTIALSPAASEIKFKSDYSVVDDIYDEFYSYSILTSNGLPLERRFNSIERNLNEFGITTVKTDEGIYNIRLPLVQKEHVVLIDNKTVFSDVIYQPETGYRQERIKVLGYKSDNWNGGLNIPGFVYDDAKITEWKSWKDYQIGSLVKYKQFYYVATMPTPGTEDFNSSFWYRLSEKPESQLMTNFDYRINQFSDFYDLDSDNFDAEQQRMAQHLIGYQKREYLANIINDDVSQYKFYQGFIQDKGTRNAIEKLFNPLGSSDKNSLEFYEEWAIQLGRYGAVDDVKQVEYILSEDKFKETPQSFELVNAIPSTVVDKVYRMTPAEVYDSPFDYNHAPFPTTNLKEYTLSGGYVHEDDVNFKAGSITELANGDVNQVIMGSYVWLTRAEPETWTVYQFVPNTANVTDLESANVYAKDGVRYLYTLSIDGWTSGLFNVGDVIGVLAATDYNLYGMYEIENVGVNTIDIAIPSNIAIRNFNDQNCSIVKLRKVRVSDLDEMNTIVQEKVYTDQKIWVDDFSNGDWATLENKPVYTDLQTINNIAQNDSSDHKFSKAMSATSNNRDVFISSPEYNDGLVNYYKRSTETANLAIHESLVPPIGIFDTLASKFGESISVSEDGNFLAVGVPNASGVKTRFKGEFDTSLTYNKNDVVKYNGNYWKANRTILPEVESQNLSTFDSYIDILQTTGANSETLSLLLTGKPFLPNSDDVDHILVRAPADMYKGTAIGEDTITLAWNLRSYANPSLSATQPWNGLISGIDSDFINGDHDIVNKVDNILYIDSFVSEDLLPVSGGVVTTNSGSATVVRVYIQNQSAVVYISETSGIFESTDDLYVNDRFVGTYQQPMVDDIEALGNFWLIEAPLYNNGDTYYDAGTGLVFVDVNNQGNTYYNIQDDVNTIGSYTTNNKRASFISHLSYSGNPNEVNGDYESNLWVVRAPTSYANETTFNFRYYQHSTAASLTDAGFSAAIIDTEQTIYDLWDGYIDFEYTNFDFTGAVYEVQVGDIIEDVQLPFNQFGGVSTTSTTTSSAEIVFYQRKFNSVRVYVKNVSGNWAKLDNTAKFDIRRIRSGEVNRITGTVIDHGNDVVLENGLIGKLMVFENSNTFPIVSNPEIIDQEYYFYTEEEIVGAGSDASSPDQFNKDYTQIYNISGDEYGIAGSIGTGVVVLYARDTGGKYNMKKVLSTEYASENRNFGKNVKIVKNNNQYKLFVASDDAVEVFDHGPATTEIYKGKWSSTTTYNQDDVVLYNGDYYTAVRDAIDTAITDASAWSNTSWKALNDVALLEINTFSEYFEVNQDGNTIIARIEYPNEFDFKIQVYTLYNGNYLLTQTITMTDDLSEPDSGWAQSIALSPNAELIAISQPLSDKSLLSTDKRDRGSVLIYKKVDGTYQYNQTLYSVKNEKSEQFGYKLAFGAGNLFVSSLFGDTVFLNTFDNGETTFDLDYTTFSKRIPDTGSVYVYEYINDKMVISEELTNNLESLRFGEYLYAINNHAYIGVPDIGLEQSNGLVIDYRKPYDAQAWAQVRSLIKPVDVSKIRGAFLYNKRENQIITYLDFIDPIQGKIAGPAEQELTHKVGYDPALYNTGTVLEGINDNVFWTDEHVGELWWNVKTASFVYPYHGNIQYQRDKWNELQPEAQVDVYEWVESDYLPSQWDTLSNTEKGSIARISGYSVYGDQLYSTKYVYDEIGQKFTAKYYFWVNYKQTIPETGNRSLSAFSVAQLIARPRQQGYRYISFLSENRFVLNNCESLMYNDDIVLNIRYTEKDETNRNLHSMYQILTDGLASSTVHPDIERKWYDSLIGVDEANNKVPATNLTPKQKYGVQNRPRQSMFVNRIEALKQIIERTNSVLKEHIVVDEYNISSLLQKEPTPSQFNGEYDIAVDTVDEIQYVGVNKIEKAVLTPVVINGRINSVKITNPGRGYKVAPSYEIVGTGTDAEIELTINNLGQIVSATVTSKGHGYGESTQITVRRFSVLVNADSTVNGRWSVYVWDDVTRLWNRKSVQDYDVTNYWEYIDWYATGYSEFVEINHVVEQSYELPILKSKIGDVVKIKNIGSGGWLLLEKINNENTEDYTINYKTIGRQNGTIQFSDTLYDSSKNIVGYDNRSFDSYFFDNDPSIELRIIFKALRDDIFTKKLTNEYNQLFFSSLRYVFAEQPYVDWAFKTSFIKIKQNLGELVQDITFNTDTMPSYRAYVDEVKPYKSVIREYINSYEAVDNTNSSVSDFDLPPAYDSVYKKIIPSTASIIDNVLIDNSTITNEYPRKHWLDNYKYSIKSVDIGNTGSGYLYKPTVEFVGGGGSGAKAEAFIGYGKITAIKVTNSGSGYTSAPTVVITGPQEQNGIPAKVTAILGNSVVRTPTIKIKFDRTSGKYQVTSLSKTESFTGTATKTVYNLEWPINLLTNTVTVYVDNVEQLRSAYAIYNVKDTSIGYTREQGRVKFATPPALDSVIAVTYQIPLSMLSAEDRINFAYNPTSSTAGEDLAQLMDGIDYGGVEVRSFDFSETTGWDTQGWYTDTWDSFETYEDYIFRFDGSTVAVDLETPLELNNIYNVYLNGIRLDDPNYGTENSTNQNAIMSSIVGDGETTTLYLDDYGIIVNEGDVLIVRKTTSDGSFIPTANSYDTALTGGDLAYTTAKGINAEEIIVDGDGFVTHTTSKGTEELVPGQVIDTLDIRVYTVGDDSTVFAYRQFKDMLNRTHFKRLDAASTTLAQDLNYYDLRIEVVDGSNLPVPSKDTNNPGIIFINKERIEYFVKDGNTLRQLRRGTLGTGVKDIHTVDSKIYNQDGTKTIPYADLSQMQTETADGNTNTWILNFVPSKIDEFEVFVAGKRLRKNSVNVFNVSLALDSPLGDTLVDAEYTFDVNSNSITTAFTPSENQQIMIVRKTGKTWTPAGVSLIDSDSAVSNFLRLGTSELPE